MSMTGRDWMKRHKDAVKERPQTVEELTRYVGRIESGEQRASLARHIGQRTICMYEALDVTVMKRIVAALLIMANNPRNASRARLRALDGIIRLMQDSVRLRRKLKRTKRGDLLFHLEELMKAMLAELSEEGARKLGETIGELSILATADDKDAGTRDASERVRIINTMLRALSRSVEMAADLEAEVESELVEPKKDMKRIKQAQKRLAEIEAETTIHQP